MNITTHTKTMPDGSKLDILKLIDSIKTKKVYYYPLNAIKKPGKDKRSGFSQNRLEHADLSQPLILDNTKFIVDGRHRYWKHWLRNKSHIPVRFANKEDLAKVKLAAIIDHLTRR